jgi:ATP-dependent DNA helicase RecG
VAQASLAALHGLLRKAMLDAFGSVMEPELGAGLRRALDAYLGARTEPSRAAAAGPVDDWTAYRAALERFDELGRQDRSVLVARGMRLCATARSARAGGVVDKPTKSRRRDEPATSTPRSGGAKRQARERARPRGTAELETVDAGPVVIEPPASATVGSLRGVGPATARKLAARGVETIEDLLYVLPTAFEDRRRSTPVEALLDGDLAVLDATIRGLRQGFARGRFLATMQLTVEDSKGRPRPVQARWFHRVGGLNDWAAGGRARVVGRAKWFRGELTLAHPELHAADAELPAIGVRYPVLQGVAPRTLSNLVRAALQAADAGSVIRDVLPLELVRAHDLPSQLEALRALHAPPHDISAEALQALQEGRSPAHRRLAFDELFFLQLWVLTQREHVRSRSCPARVPEDGFDRERIRVCLPFEPTAAQWRVIGEIEHDMTSGPPMLRLLQGDVGSGKTAVAFAAALGVVAGGSQVALMAPTEILAEQHHRTLGPWCERAGLRIALLTGSTPRAERTSLLALVEAGRIDVVVGTHALIVGDVAFARLGLVVVDEQHRFGVEQRGLLRGKGDMPHLLVMTATPIPRTMALTAYGELDVSVLDELPPGRTPPETFLFAGARGLARARAGLAKRVAAGDRAFVVCPLVESSEVLEVTDVEATATDLRALLPEHRIAVVHGRMTSKDKDAVMSAFRRGDLDVLVATTVIEVGVDIPDARVMLVEHAERFGLAQLHQLRGRVGRGGGVSYCLLHTIHGPKSEVAQRLGVLTQTTDGFVVAERDLELRGPGEVFGTRQAGAPRLRFWSFAGEGSRMLVAARETAAALLAADPGLVRHPEVRAELQRRHAVRGFFSPESG